MGSGLGVGGHESDGPGLGVHGIDAVADTGARLALGTFTKRHDVARGVSAPLGGFGASEALQFENGCDQRLAAELAFAQQREPNRVGEVLALLPDLIVALLIGVARVEAARVASIVLGHVEDGVVDVEVPCG